MAYSKPIVPANYSPRIYGIAPVNMWEIGGRPVSDDYYGFTFQKLKLYLFILSGEFARVFPVVYTLGRVLEKLRS